MSRISQLLAASLSHQESKALERLQFRSQGYDEIGGDTLKTLAILRLVSSETQTRKPTITPLGKDVIFHLLSADLKCA